MVTDENDFPARRTLQANVPSSGWLASSAKPPSIQRHTKPAVLPYIPPPFAPTTAPNPLPLIPYTTAAVSESNQKNLVLSPGADIGRPAVCEDEAKDADSQMILTQVHCSTNYLYPLHTHHVSRMTCCRRRRICCRHRLTNHSPPPSTYPRPACLPWTLTQHYLFIPVMSKSKRSLSCDQRHGRVSRSEPRNSPASPSLARSTAD